LLAVIINCLTTKENSTATPIHQKDSKQSYLKIQIKDIKNNSSLEVSSNKIMNSTEAQSKSTPIAWKNYFVEGLKTTSSNIVNTSYNIIKSIEEKSHVYSTAFFYVKIFGLLAIFIIFIYLSKVFIRKINSKLLLYLFIDSFSGENNLSNESAGNQYQGKKDYEITKPGKSNDDQDQFKPKSQ